MKRNVLLIGLVLVICFCQAQTFKFAVLCDTRSSGDNNGKDGVNVAAVSAVCNHLKESGAEFVIAPGDFICGNVTWYDTIEGPPSNHMQYQAFLDAARSAGLGLPGENDKITLYPVRGNHECYQKILPKDSIVAAWINNIGYTLPKTGPKNETGFTYYFEHNGSLFLALDQYMHAEDSQKEGICVDQGWIDKVLKKHPGAKHVFAFGHTPAFVAHHKDCLGEDPEARNVFMRSISLRSGVYFCGHDHFYARAEVPVYNQDGSIEKYLQQVITPTGAPYLGTYSPKWDGKYKDKDVKPEKYIDNYLGYQLVTVEGDQVKVEFIATDDASSFTIEDGKYLYTYNDNWQSWNFETMDAFSFKQLHSVIE